MEADIIYKELVDEIDGLITEGVFSSRWTLIETYHQIGEKLTNYSVHESIKPEDLVQRVAKDTGKSKRTMYQSMQFYKKYPDINTLSQGKNISWHKICNELLPEHKKDKPTLDEKIKQFIEDLYPRDKRKEFITIVLKDWEFWRLNR